MIDFLVFVIEVVLFLFGVMIWCGLVGICFIEVEVYMGFDDLVFYVFCGLILCVCVMFGLFFYIYVYLFYGMYCCVNFVCLLDGEVFVVLLCGG